MNAARVRTDAELIWTAALQAVMPQRLVAARLSVGGRPRQVRLDGNPLDPPLALDAIERIVVVGGGKAAAGLAAGIADLLGPAGRAAHRVTGLVSVPAGCGRSLPAIEVRETRPAQANLPTPAVVQATAEMLDAVAALGPRDLVIALITGGGSALLAAPRAGVSLADKIALTRRLSESGADIATLNAARRTLSRVKGGGLAVACTAGQLLALVISDVIGTDLDVIASGPCMPPDHSSPRGRWVTPGGCSVQHVVLGDNATAVAAAAAAAQRAGYEVVAAAGPPEGSAEEVGRRLAGDADALVETVGRDGRPRALIAGGEATVTVPDDHGIGGRNQQTVLAVIDRIRRAGRPVGGPWPAGLLIASIGTDGEDGPTAAAGGVADATVAAAIDRLGLDVPRALGRCDALPLLDAAGGLIRTGPTGTNVADLRIVLARA